jgi:sugar O-acyltransferase (sialic acid O-acetyltransferase NeuD family)
MKRKLLIVGTGPFAEIAALYFNDYSNYDIIGFACHSKFRNSSQIHGRDLFAIEDLPKIASPDLSEVFIAIGYGKMNQMRESVFLEMAEKGYTFANFIHPSVRVWANTVIGRNVFIFEDNTIQPFTTIGDNTVLWSGNHIGHHSKIGDHCFISSHVVISGNCHVGRNVFMGVNATLHDSLTIGDYCLIGAGAIISKDTKAREVFVPIATKPFPKSSAEIGF